MLGYSREIYVLWRPTIRVYVATNAYNHSTDFTTDGWCPIKVETHWETFTERDIIDKSYSSYLSKIKQFDFYFLRSNKENSSYNCEMIAQNRSGKIVSLRYIFTSTVSDTKEGAKLVILPTSKEVSSHILIQTLIERTGVNKIPTPIWIENVVIEEEKTLNKQRIIKEQELRNIDVEIEKIKEGKSLLYSTGSELEESCKAVLKEIGVNIKDSPAGISDFVIETEIMNLLVEVKGNTKQVLKEDISQLVTDVGQYINTSEKPVKGLLISNTWRQLSLDERKKKGNPFVKEVLDIAKRQDICILQSELLFKLYLKYREKTLNVKQLLKELTMCKGPYTIIDKS